MEMENEEIESFECEACDMTFNSSEELDDHNSEFHGAPNRAPSPVTEDTKNEPLATKF